MGLGGAPGRTGGDSPPPGRGARPEAPGDASGPVYGRLGVLADDGVRARCHVCGAYFHYLAVHVQRGHGLSPDAYRRRFGLNVRTGLTGPALRAVKAAQARRTLAPSAARGRAALAALTPEARAANNRVRPRRLEARLDPANQAVWRESTRKGRARAAELRRDPAHRAQLSARLSAARGGRHTVACLICGAPFPLPPSRAGTQQRLACGPACAAEYDRRHPRRVPIVCAAGVRQIRQRPRRGLLDVPGDGGAWSYLALTRTALAGPDTPWSWTLPSARRRDAGADPPGSHRGGRGGAAATDPFARRDHGLCGLNTPRAPHTSWGARGGRLQCRRRRRLLRYRRGGAGATSRHVRRTGGRLDVPTSRIPLKVTRADRGGVGTGGAMGGVIV